MSGDIQNRPKFKYVDFDLPFVLFIKDSLGDLDLEKWAEAFASGDRPLPYARYAPQSEKPGSMIIGGGFPVYIPPKPLARYYEITLPNLLVGLRTLRRANPHRNTILMGEVPGDRTGRASFTSVRVMFDLSQIRDDHHWNMTMFCSLAVKAVNHFIEHYRVIADRPYVEPVTLSVIQEFHLVTEFENGQMQSQEFGSGSGPLHGFGGALPDDLESTLREAVLKPEPPDIDQILDVNIRNHLDLGEWRLAVIESAVMFEAWLSRYLRNKFMKNGVSAADIDARFKKRDGAPKSITTIARYLVLEATGFDFSTTLEYSEWATKVRDLRNELVHGQSFDITRLEAQIAYKATCEAIALLKTV